MSMFEFMASDDTRASIATAGRSRGEVVRDFAASELFDRTFSEGMELVEETAAYLDGDGRRESKLLSRASALAYAGESMKLTTRLMQVASWLLVQRAVREGDMAPEAACEPRYRLNERKTETEVTDPELPIALVEYLVRADKLYDRALYLDRRMYLDAPDDEPVNPVQSQMDRLTAAFRQ
jgi:regulator of CtrA degradation